MPARNGSVSGGCRVPAQRAQKRGKDAWIVRPMFGDGGPSLASQKFGVEFGVPKDGDEFPLGVVVDAGKS
jgi:hypothetical protein